MGKSGVCGGWRVGGEVLGRVGMKMVWGGEVIGGDEGDVLRGGGIGG